MTNPVDGYQAWLNAGAVPSMIAVRRISAQLRKDTKPRSDGTGRFRGSLIGADCDRQQALSYLGADQGPTDLRYAASGTWAHLRWQAAGLTMGWLTDIEVPVRYGRWFKGSADGLMDDGRVFELKTTRSTVLKRMKSPKEMHKDQVTLYSAAAKAPGAIIVYEGREDLATKIFDVPMDWDRYERIISRVKRIKTIADHGGLPDMHPDCTPMSVMREYCSFRDTCLHRFVADAQPVPVPS